MASRTAADLNGDAPGSSPGQLLSAYALEPPEWCKPLLANKEPALYADFYPGATALYPQSHSHASAHLPGFSRDSSLSASGSGGNHYAQVPGVTASKEDDLSEAFIKGGFVNKAVVQTENFSAHALIHNKLHNGPSIPALGKVLQKVLERQAQDDALTPKPGPWTYKPPSKVVYNASRLESWYSDLANPSVPLSKLAKTIPSAPSASSQPIISAGIGTYTGTTSSSSATNTTLKTSGSAMDKNLEMLIARQIPVSRAVWFLQAVGQNDIAQMTKSKNLHVHPLLAYSSDFTGALVDAIKRQINEVLLPLAHQGHGLNTGSASGRLLPGMSVKGQPRNVLADNSSKERWLSKWTYSLELLAHCVLEDMIDKRRLCALLLDLLRGSRDAKFYWWISILLQTVSEELMEVDWMRRSLLKSVLLRMNELQPSSEGDEERTALAQACAALVLYIWRVQPETFVLPDLLAESTVRETIRNILESDGNGLIGPEDASTWANIQERVYFLLCRRSSPSNGFHKTDSQSGDATENSLPEDPSKGASEKSAATRKQLGQIVILLDGFDGTSSVATLTVEIMAAISPGDGSALPADEMDLHLVTTLPHIVRLLAYWATSRHRFGHHRTFLIGAILSHLPIARPPAAHEGEREASDAHRRSTRGHLPELICNSVIEWLDETASESGTFGGKKSPCDAALFQLCQALLDCKILEVSSLLQKVLARGAGKDVNAQKSIYMTILQQCDHSCLSGATLWQMRKHLLMANDKKTSDELEAGVRDHVQSTMQTLEEAWNDSVGSSAIASAKTRPQDRKLSSDQGLPDSYFAVASSLASITTKCSQLPHLVKTRLVRHSFVPAVESWLSRKEGMVVGHWIVPLLLDCLKNLDTMPELWRILVILSGRLQASTSELLLLVCSFQAFRPVFACLQNVSHFADNLFNAFVSLPEEQTADNRIVDELANFALLGYLSSADALLLGSRIHGWSQQSRNLQADCLAAPETTAAQNGDKGTMQTILALFRKTLEDPDASALTSHHLASASEVASLCARHANADACLIIAIKTFMSQVELSDVALLRLLQLAADVKQSLKPLKTDASSCLPFDSEASSGVYRHFSQSDRLVCRQLLVRGICKPISILRHLVLPTLEIWKQRKSLSIESAFVLSDFVVDLLARESFQHSDDVMLNALRPKLYTKKAFPTILRVVQAIKRNEQWLASQENIPQAEVYTHLSQDILRTHHFQTAFVADHERCAAILQDQDTEHHTSAPTSSSNDLLWEVLRMHFGANGLPDCVEKPTESCEDRGEVWPAFDGKEPSCHLVIVAGLWQLFLQHYLARTKGGETGEGSPHTASLLLDGNPDRRERPKFVANYLNFLAICHPLERTEHLTLLVKYAAQELVQIGMAALTTTLCKTQQLSSSSLTITKDHLASKCNVLVDILAQSTQLILSSVGSTRLAKNDPSSSHLLQAINAWARSIPSNDAHNRLLLYCKATCLAATWTSPSARPEGLYLRTIESTMLLLAGASAPSSHRETAQDMVVWLLDDLSSTSREQVLRPYQRSFPTIGAAHRPVCRNGQTRLHLGPLPSLAYFLLEGNGYIALHRAWNSCPGEELRSFKNSAEHARQNAQGLDLWKFHCETISLCDEPKGVGLAAEDRGQRDNFDFSTPLQRETTLQRDFRRAAVIPPDFPPPGPANAKGTASVPSREKRPENAESASTMKLDSGHRAAPVKKRKAVPDVIVITEPSPKKRPKPSSATVAANSKSQKQKK